MSYFVMKEKKIDKDLPESIIDNSLKTKPVYNLKKLWWYLVTVEVYYREDKLKQVQRLNVIISSPEKGVVAKTLNDIRNLVFMRMNEQYKVSHENIYDYIILNIVLLHYGSEKDHFTKHINQKKEQ